MNQNQEENEQSTKLNKAREEYFKYVNEFKYPPLLAAACINDGQYMLQTKSGKVIEFEFAAAFSTEWVLLYPDNSEASISSVSLRVSEIEYVTHNLDHDAFKG